MVERLKSDGNVLAVALCEPSVLGVKKGREQVDLLVLVSHMPFDLDLRGKKMTNYEGLEISFTYYRPERLETAIDDEAGCWFSSGKVLYSKSLYDPTKVLYNLRKKVNSVSREKRAKAVKSWLEEARHYPDVVAGRRLASKRTPEEKLLSDNVALSRLLFLLNARPPRRESSIVDELMALDKIPPGFGRILGLLQRLEAYDSREFRKARKEYDGTVASIESMANQS